MYHNGFFRPPSLHFLSMGFSSRRYDEGVNVQEASGNVIFRSIRRYGYTWGFNENDRELAQLHYHNILSYKFMKAYGLNSHGIPNSSNEATIDMAVVSR